MLRVLSEGIVVEWSERLVLNDVYTYSSVESKVVSGCGEWLW